jgi:hypothetical protein
MTCGFLLVEVFFTLMTNRQNGDRFVVLYLDERNKACRAKWNDEFTQERIGILRLSAREGHRFSESVGLFYRGSRTDGCGTIAGCKKIEQPLQVCLRSPRDAEPITH